VLTPLNVLPAVADAEKRPHKEAVRPLPGHQTASLACPLLSRQSRRPVSATQTAGGGANRTFWPTTRMWTQHAYPALTTSNPHRLYQELHTSFSPFPGGTCEGPDTGTSERKPLQFYEGLERCGI